MHKEIEQTFNEILLPLDPSDPTFEVRKSLINIEKAENLDALKSMNKHKKNNQKRKFFDIDKKN